MTKYNTEEVNELIQNRRSIYPAQYTDEKVDDEIINQMLENANWAPNHRHTEPWRFIIFTGEGLNTLGKFQAEVYEENSKKHNNFDEAKKENLRNKPMTASHVIAIGMKRDPKNSVPEVEELSAVAAAVQNMQLTATAYGIGCYWGSGGITYMEEARHALGMEKDDRLLGFLYVGVPKEGFWPKGKRNSIEDKINWVRS